MKKHLTYPFVLLLIFSALSVRLQAQIDTEFWFAVPEVETWSYYQIDRPINVVIATGSTPATISITQPAAGSTMPAINLNIPANAVHKEDVTAHIDILESKPASTALNYGLRIVSDVPVSVYYEVMGQGTQPQPSNPEVFTLKGRNGLGTSFLIASQNFVGNNPSFSGPPPASSSFDIIATEDNTSIAITPTAALRGGYPAGTPFNITLDRGQTWSATASGGSAADQLSGSRVSADKPVAVTVKGDLLNSAAIGAVCSDLTGEQIVPVNLLGTEYIAMNGDLAGVGDQLFVTALNNNTEIYRDGIATPLAIVNSGQTYRLPVAVATGQGATYIRTTGPVGVWQLSGIGCEMGATQLPQIECSGSSSIYYARSFSLSLFVSLVVPAGGQGNFTMNGTPLTTATWTAVPGTASQWFSTRLDLTSQVAAGSILSVTNSTHLFHMSVLDGGATGGTSYGYFSNYNSVRAEASASANNLCAGDSIQLQARMVQNGIYQWTGPAGFNSNQQDPVISNAGSSCTGWYYLTVTTGTGSCGSSMDSVYVLVHSLPAADLGQDVTVCLDSLTLRSPSVSNAAYQWSTGATSDTLVVRISDTYRLTVTDNTTGCSNSDTIVVTLGAAISVDLGPDTAVCDYNLPYVLSSPQPVGTTYLWSNGYSDPEMEVIRTDRFWLQVSRNGCTGSDTINIEVVSKPNLFIGGYQVICASVPEEIGIEVPGAEYLWNTGATTSHISVNETGLYWLEVNLKGCRASDSAYIVAQPDPVVDLGPDGYICTDQEIVLDAGNPGCVYYWSTGSDDRVLQVSTAGLYHVTVVSPDSCVGRDSILLTHLPDPIVLFGIDTTVCEETPLILRPYVLNAEALLWSDGSNGNSLSVAYGGTYTITGINECGVSADTINVRQIFCDIWVPNVFTPNGDGRNDVYRVLGNLARVEGFGLSIFDRWGQRVFYTSDKYQGWDGLYNGVPSMMGTFVYMLEYQIEGRPVLEKGNFHLIR